MHYLESELRALIRDDHSIFDFLESQSLDGMWYRDLEKPENQWMGPGFWKELGMDPTTREHLAAEWRELLHPEDVDAAQAQFEAHIADPTGPFDQVVRYRHADGSTVWVRCRGRVILDAEGKPKRMFGTHMNLTDVMERQAELRAFVEALPGVAMILDAQGRYLNIMSAREKMMAISEETLIGKRVTDVLPAHSSAPVMATIAKTLETGEPQTVEYNITTPVGVVWFEGRTVPLPPDSSSSEPRVIWLAHDITDRKIIALDLERRNKDLKQFAHIASHDLRAPLHTIVQLTNWLEDDCQDSISEEGKNFVELIHSRAERMGHLIQSLLRYAKTPDSAELVPICTNTAVAEALEMVFNEGERFTLDVQSDMPTITTDPVLFQQVVQNLVGNAIKHHHKQSGRIEIRCTPTDFGHDITVTDDGPGIPPEYRQSIFQVFQTLRPRDEAENSGIGLSIVKKAVESMSGTVSIDDGEGPGTTFRVSLPSDPHAAMIDQIQA